MSQLFSKLESGMRVFVHGQSATPHELIQEMILTAKAKNLKDIETVHLHTVGESEYTLPENQKHFRTCNLFVGANLRGRINFDTVDYLPCFLSEMPQLFRSGKRPVDIALIHVSPPDAHGYCSLGVSVDIARAAVDTARIIIAQINPRMPKTLGDGLIHESEFDEKFYVDRPLPESFPKPASTAEIQIGKNVASLIEDGSTLQTGIGSIPDATLQALTQHRDLGIHTEMWSDGALKLIESGVITNCKKKAHPGKTVSTFIVGSQRVYDFIHDNPSVVQLDASYVNNPYVISKNPKVVAINSAVEIDLTGQVCADSIGNRIISGVGGQLDFITGASLCPDGKAIIALTSRTAKGQSRIVPHLKFGAGVVTTRAHVHFVVTEFGIADLYGKTIGERAKALIEIAHPDDRESLGREWNQIKNAKP